MKVTLPVAAGKKVLRVLIESAPVLLQTGTGVAATKEVPWAGRTITGRKGGMDITSFFTQSAIHGASTRDDHAPVFDDVRK